MAGKEPVFMAPLPEDALLEVFRWLPPLELLRGPRAVCRAWRQAALHPWLWQNRSLDDKYCSRRELLAVLRLAPCLRRLVLSNHELDPARHTLATTNCAVTELQLGCASLVIMMLLRSVPSRGTDYFSALRRQVELGHLRVLTLKPVTEELAEDAIRLVLQADLTALSFKWEGPIDLACLPDGLSGCSRKPRMRSLIYYSCTDSRDAFLEQLLETHAASLESVALPRLASRHGLKLLASCPKLRAAEVPAEWPQANSLSRCTQLVKLALRVAHDRPPPLQEFFQSEVAAQLTELSFLASLRSANRWMNLDSITGHSDALQLVATLSASGRSVLRELNLCAMLGVRLEWSWLSGVLRGLPGLHTLRAQSPIPEAAMDCITPALAPSLRLLQFTNIGPVEHQCGEQHCSYLQSACRLVERNPQLHVMGLAKKHSCLGEQAVRCRWWGLFPEAPEEQADDDDGHDDGAEAVPRAACRRVGLYGHGDGDACGLEEHSGPVTLWERPSCFTDSRLGVEKELFSLCSSCLDEGMCCGRFDEMHEWVSASSVICSFNTGHD